MDLSIGEMMMIGIAIVVLFGPKKLPQIARDLGSGVRKMRGAVEDIKTEILADEDNPVSEIKREIDKVKKAAQEGLAPEEWLPAEDSQKSAEPKKPVIDQLDDNYEGPVSR